MLKTSPHSTIVTLVSDVGIPPGVNLVSLTILSTSSLPSVTSPKTTCFSSRCGSFSFNVIKNCDPFEFGPLFAMLNKYFFECERNGVSSSNFPP